MPFSQPQNLLDVGKASSPGLIYTVVAWFANVPIEKWVSAATLILVILQIIFLIRDRFKKRRAARKGGA